MFNIAEWKYPFVIVLTSDSVNKVSGIVVSL